MSEGAAFLFLGGGVRYVPEPSPLLGLGFGGALLALLRHRRSCRAPKQRR